MANMPLAEAFQDETNALRFLLDSPWHAVVLGRISSAMEKYQNAHHTAVLAGNDDLQQEIALVTRFLKNEASDRVNIKFEYLVVEAFEALWGSEAVDGLLDFQRRFVAEQQVVEWAAIPDCHKLALEFEEAGLSRIPSWGIESGRACIGQQTRLRLARHHLFKLTRDMQRAQSRGERHLCWRLKLRCQDARQMLRPLASIECKSKALTTIKALHGEDVSHKVLAWVKSNTRLQEYEATRNAIQSIKFVYPTSSGSNLVKRA